MHLPNEFDLIECDVLSETTHRRLVSEIKAYLKEREIEDDLDFEIIHGDRARRCEEGKDVKELKGVKGVKGAPRPEHDGGTAACTLDLRGRLRRTRLSPGWTRHRTSSPRPGGARSMLSRRCKHEVLP